jgi:hypothetical protein
MNRGFLLENLKEELLQAINRLQPGEQLQTATIERYLGSVREMKQVDPKDISNMSERMRDLAVAVDKLVQDSKLVASEQMLLKSLCFPTMKLRYAKVATAYSSTFDWIFDNETNDDIDSEQERIKYVDWLTSGNGAYFIMGKPGAGKSTLMKFLCDSPKTRQLLDSWAGRNKLVIAKYFFWHGGTKLQKSQEGLLQSLLFEVLRRCHELIPKVCRTFIEYLPFQDAPLPWTLPELLESFRLLREQKTSLVKFCFFVDGLDEYDISNGGSSNDLVRVLDELANSPDIKICVSSRPWNEFRDHFAQDPDRFLTLEKLTKPDMWRYVNETLEKNPRFRELKSKDEYYPTLVNEIVNKAQGVFLWVFLVVTSLSKGISNADRVVEMQKRLAELPGSLEDYFRHIFNTVEDVYKVPTAQAFEVALQGAEPLSVMTFSLLDDLDGQEATDFAIKAKVEPLTMQEMNSRFEDMRRRLDARCKGLLEITPSWGRPTGVPSQFTVDFLHRTVRDFLLLDEMQIMLKERLMSDEATSSSNKDDFNAKLRLCQAFLLQLKRLPDTTKLKIEGNSPDHNLLDDIFYYARDLELETQDKTAETSKRILSLLFRILDDFERVLYCSSSRWEFKRKKNMFMGIAVQRDLQLYIQKKLQANTEALHSRARPLLDFALTPASSKYGADNLSARMVALLLSFGANPNIKYKDSTIWGRFIFPLRGKDMATPGLNELPENKELLDILALLIQNGADLEKKFVIGTRKAPSTGKAADMYRGDIDIFCKASKIINDTFSKEDVKFLLGKAPPPPPAAFADFPTMRRIMGKLRFLTEKEWVLTLSIVFLGV